MSFKSRLRLLTVCVILEMGALCNVPMRPEEIQELLHQIHEPKLAHVLPSDDDDGGGAPPDGNGSPTPRG